MEIRLPYVFLSFLLLAGCNPYNPQQQAILDSLKGKPIQKFVEVPPWIGIYQDTLPCADCLGALTRLEFKTDTSYKKSVTLLGKGDPMANTSSTTGRWYWKRKEGLILLDSASEKKRFALLIMGDSALHLCNEFDKPMASARYSIGRL